MFKALKNRNLKLKIMSKTKSVLLEICSFSLESSINAFNGNANRIELCGGFHEGGTTPSVGLIKQVLTAVSIPVYVMIRPRGGDFLYSKTEAKVMLEDIAMISELKPAGFVFGALTDSGDLDIKLMKSLINETGNSPITFHRAIDVCQNPQKIISQLIDLGVENILTSGQKDKAINGKKMISDMVMWSKGQINIMAGSGINIQNAQEILECSVNALHFTAKKEYPSKMSFRNKNVNMGGDFIDEFMNYEASVETIGEMAELLKNQ